VHYCVDIRCDNSEEMRAFDEGRIYQRVDGRCSFAHPPIDLIALRKEVEEVQAIRQRRHCW
jgi:hypothetical protein